MFRAVIVKLINALYLKVLFINSIPASNPKYKKNTEGKKVLVIPRWFGSSIVQATELKANTPKKENKLNKNFLMVPAKNQAITIE